MNARASILAVLLLCAGCAVSPQLRLYEGNARAAADVAVITLPEQLEVASINGKQVPGARGMWKTGESSSKCCRAATRRWSTIASSGRTAMRTEVVRSKNAALFVIDAQAGHRYRIDYEHPAHHADATKLAWKFPRLGSKTEIPAHPACPFAGQRHGFQDRLHYATQRRWNTAACCTGAARYPAAAGGSVAIVGNGRRSRLAFNDEGVVAAGESR